MRICPVMVIRYKSGRTARDDARPYLPFVVIDQTPIARYKSTQKNVDHVELRDGSDQLAAIARDGKVEEL